jgi:HaeIII-like restriction endonuclease
MSGAQERNGKANEYAFTLALQEELLSRGCDVGIVSNSIYENAKNKFGQLLSVEQAEFLAANREAIKHIMKLEPSLAFSKGQKIVLSLQPDSSGTEGDVRDVLCVRSTTTQWEIGFSMKNNSVSIKSIRLGKKFLQSNFGISPSAAYTQKYAGLVDNELKPKRGMKWHDAYSNKDKEVLVYIPALEMVAEEIEHQLKAGPAFARKLMKRFLGSFDYYKITKTPQLVRVEGVNIDATLNRNYGNIAPEIAVPQLPLPTKMVSSQIREDKEGQKNTLDIELDNGLRFALRVHNKDSTIKGKSLNGLGFEVSLTAHPREYYVREMKYSV